VTRGNGWDPPAPTDGSSAPLDPDSEQADRRLRKKIKFIKPPKLHITEDGAVIKFDLINVGDSSAGVSFKVSYKGETLSVDAPSVHLNAGSGPVGVKIELPTDGGFSRGSKIKVEVQGPGGTTIAASSTGAFVMSVPGVGTVALGPAGVTATAIVALGAVATVGYIIASPNDTGEDPEVALAGDWSAGTFTLDDSGNAVGFGPIEGGPMSFRPVDPSCEGAACDLTATEAPDFLLGSTLRPDGEGGYETEFVADELQTILSFTGPITCQGDGVETTPLGELEFDAGIYDETDELRFFIRIDLPAAGACEASFIEWSALARRIGEGD
jgi:hypothetical protein